MRVPRIYQPTDLAAALANSITVSLADDAANHVGRVLRMQAGQRLQLFCGDGFDYEAQITTVSKRNVEVILAARQAVDNEAPLAIHLAQGISRGDRMDFVLQKSVELGVHAITPLFTERCGVKLSGERLEKKQQQWQKIVIAACEQSGRASVPEVLPALSLETWLQQPNEALCLTLDPYAAAPVRKLSLPASKSIRLVIGPEGGFSEAEIELTRAHQFKPVRLGPRILRTETAALAALTVLNYEFGDLA